MYNQYWEKYQIKSFRTWYRNVNRKECTWGGYYEGDTSTLVSYDQIADKAPSPSSPLHTHTHTHQVSPSTSSDPCFLPHIYECVCEGQSVCMPLTMLSLCWCSTAVTHTFPLTRCCYVGFIIMATYRRKGVSMNHSVLLCLRTFLLCSNSFVSVSCHFVHISRCLIFLSHCEDLRVLCNSSLG